MRNNLIKRLLNLDDIDAWQAAHCIKELERELKMLTTAGIIEVAVRNPSVADYVQHWEGRAEAAEAKLAKAVKCLQWYADHCMPKYAGEVLAKLEGKNAN